jgi:hypothetical protein
MDLLNHLIYFLISMRPKQTTQIDITSAELDELIKSTLDIEVDYEREDTSYMLVNLDFLEKHVSASFVPDMVYEKEVFDCDEFSLTMRAMFKLLRQNHCVGRIKVDKTPSESGGVHSLNLFIGEDYNIYLLEPQSGKYFVPPSDWEYLKLTI